MNFGKKPREGAHSRPAHRKKWKKGLVIAIAAAAAAVLAIIALAIYTFTCTKAFAKVLVGGESVSGMMHEEIVALLDERSDAEYSAVEFDIKVDDSITHVTAADLKAARDSVAAADAAMAVGRDGSVIGRMWDVLVCLVAGRDISPSALLDDASLDAVLAKVAEKSNVAPVHAGYTVEGDVLTLTPPKDGVKVDAEALRSEIRARFDTNSYDDIVTSVVTDKATVLDMDEVYKAVHTTVKDATMTHENGEHKISPHVVGVDFDLAAAKKEHSANPDKIVKIPLTLTQPKVTTIMLQATLFKDTLSTVTTYFSPKKVARTHNVALAAKYMNGTVLNPGETFSYNKTVGPRTAARGFKEAQIFSQGEVVDGLGGGICQVSSTLYMATMKANMKTVSRKNHSFYVDYAPKGQDATVVYGAIDFQFENTSPYPIKIVAYQKNNYIKVSIMGTKTETRTVKIQTKTLATKPFTEKIVEDPSLKPGERVIEQKGQEGITMNVYRLVYDGNGKLLSNTLENKTKYVPMPQIVRVGPAAAGTSAPVETPAEKPSETPAEKPSETPAEKPSDAPPAEKPEEKPSDPPVEKPAETPAETPEETPAETPAETPTDAPSDPPAETPEEKPAEAPSETPEEAPAETPTDAPVDPPAA